MILSKENGDIFRGIFKKTKGCKLYMHVYAIIRYWDVIVNQPLRKFPAFLFSIDFRKVKSFLLEKIEMYQEEYDRICSGQCFQKTYPELIYCWQNH